MLISKTKIDSLIDYIISEHWHENSFIRAFETYQSFKIHTSTRWQSIWMNVCSKKVASTPFLFCNLFHSLILLSSIFYTQSVLSFNWGNKVFNICTTFNKCPLMCPIYLLSGFYDDLNYFDKKFSNYNFKSYVNVKRLIKLALWMLWNHQRNVRKSLIGRLYNIFSRKLSRNI